MQDRKCICKPPFSGEFCEYIDCGNGDAVIQENGDGYCSCSPGYTGTFCTKIEYCFHGFNITENSTVCNCDMLGPTGDYSGDVCDTPNCQNGGTPKVKHFHFS